MCLNLPVPEVGKAFLFLLFGLFSRTSRLFVLALLVFRRGRGHRGSILEVVLLFRVAVHLGSASLFHLGLLVDRCLIPSRVVVVGPVYVRHVG